MHSFMSFAFCLICSINKLCEGELPSKRLTWGIRFPFVCTLHCFQAHGAYLQLLFAFSLVYEGNEESWTSVVGYTSSNLEELLWHRWKTLSLKQWRAEFSLMPHRLSLPLHKPTRDTSLWLVYVCMGGRLRGGMNETVFANSCEKQKSFLCSLDFTFYEAVLSACSRKDLMLWKAISTV